MGFEPNVTKKQKATAISMKFKGNSKLLEDFMDAVERGLV